jgi:hypothetical protein
MFTVLYKHDDGRKLFVQGVTVLPREGETVVIAKKSHEPEFFVCKKVTHYISTGDGAPQHSANVQIGSV